MERNTIAVRQLQLLLTVGLFIVIGCASKQVPIPATNPVQQIVAFDDQMIYQGHPDGKTDNTAKLQLVMDELSRRGGGVIRVPRGQYLFAGRINVPQGVTLEGIWTSVPAHNGLRDAGLPKPTDDGTTFLVTADEGTEDAPAFMTLNTNTTVKGVCFFYPNQKLDDVPIAYPYAIAMRAKNPAVLDCELLNPYNGIDTTTSERHLIRNVHGQPLRRGIFVDHIMDIGRIENVHFNPWYSMKPKLFEWQMNNGEAFIFGRSDWQYVLNTFCFGYKTGYRFIKTKSGTCNGNFVGIGADDCQTALVVDDCAPMALLITNGEFVSFHGPNPTMIRVEKTNTGVVRFVNCAYWGPCNQIAQIDGTGTVGFTDCTFMQWDQAKKGLHAIQAAGGSVLVRGCEFWLPRPQIQLGENVTRAVITDNLIKGPVLIENKSSGNVAIDNNVSNEKPAAVAPTVPAPTAPAPTVPAAPK